MKQVVAVLLMVLAGAANATGLVSTYDDHSVNSSSDSSAASNSRSDSTAVSASSSRSDSQSAAIGVGVGGDSRSTAVAVGGQGGKGGDAVSVAGGGTSVAAGGNASSQSAGGQSAANNSFSYTEARDHAPSASTPAAVIGNTTASCRSFIGISGMGRDGGGGLGFPVVDQDCKLGALAAQAAAFGNDVLAARLFCKGPTVRKAVGETACLQSFSAAYGAR